MNIGLRSRLAAIEEERKQIEAEEPESIEDAIARLLMAQREVRLRSEQVDCMRARRHSAPAFEPV
jgi:hypothetical protein